MNNYNKIAEEYYCKYLYHFIENNIPFEQTQSFFCLDDNVTYKFNFYLKQTTQRYYNIITTKQHQVFAKIFLINNWKEELQYSLFSNNYKYIKPNKYYSDNYGEIIVNTKPFVDYITFQHGRVIVQLNINKLIRLEKLKKLQNESTLH